ncbi:hypothetical protein GLE_4274 [Lysobacter enzymogenes]|uniref:Uncharacterized protein n=1 Tax=Lysobacter enzymogenes TaxID=69 RepID=A0A0S2DMW0_LYSEN|nr:hypothetical protein GLE_4274 [Lysobacter enzymogenes]
MRVEPGWSERARRRTRRREDRGTDRDRGGARPRRRPRPPMGPALSRARATPGAIREAVLATDSGPGSGCGEDDAAASRSGRTTAARRTRRPRSAVAGREGDGGVTREILGRRQRADGGATPPSPAQAGLRGFRRDRAGDHAATVTVAGPAGREGQANGARTEPNPAPPGGTKTWTRSLDPLTSQFTGCRRSATTALWKSPRREAIASSRKSAP